MSKMYEQKAGDLSKAIDIAIEAFEKIKPDDWDDVHVQHVVSTYLQFKSEVLFPDPKYKNLKSLSYHEEAVFTYFQESSGKTVEYFWQKLHPENLPFKRINKLKKILTRKKIKNDIEYDFVIDILVPYQQQGLINTQEVEILNVLICEFENK